MPAASLHDRARFVEMDVDGAHLRLASLHLDRASDEGTRRFLLVHGNPSHMEHFAANVEWLQRHGEVALFDLPGFGESLHWSAWSISTINFA